MDKYSWKIYGNIFDREEEQNATDLICKIKEPSAMIEVDVLLENCCAAEKAKQ